MEWLILGLVILLTVIRVPIAFALTLTTAFFLLWQGGVMAQLAAIPAPSWLLLVLMGLVLCAVSFAVQYGVTHLAANRAVVLFLFELVVAAVSSYFLAGEAMGWRDWSGAVLIVSASLLSGKLYSGKGVG